ncbi:MAG TPA: NCS2 family permease [Oligoflexia bacterium]|mgnify:CR=1 FL=1|nr:NCS2 family permease [Oligoflexia bacterium]
MIERIFHLAENKTTLRTECLAGLATFLTMAYIIFVQPAVLSGVMFGINTGMDFNAVTAATCVSSALACLIMGFYARYPIALAPGMGENFFFVLSAIPAAAAAGHPHPWQAALGAVFIAGLLFFVLYAFGVRERLFDAISPSMKLSIAAGIGLFIAFIGFQNTGLIIKSPGTAVQLNTHFLSPDLLIFFFGLLLTAALHVRKVPGAILWGIASTTVLAAALRLFLPYLSPAIVQSRVVAESMLMTRFEIAAKVVSAPPSMSPTLMKMDLHGALSPALWPLIVIFLFMAVFDTIGTLVGVGEQAGLIKDNKLPRARQAMLADQFGILIGAVCGTSTITCYIESAVGVEAGGRTGFVAVLVALFFLLALFFSPLIAMVGSYPPITAPALVLVGAMMMQSAAKIEWSDFSESVPAFLVLAGIPLAYSIADGLALGFIAYPVIKLFSGRGREVNCLMYVLAVVLALYFVFVRSQMG